MFKIALICLIAATAMIGCGPAAPEKPCCDHAWNKQPAANYKPTVVVEKASSYNMVLFSATSRRNDARCSHSFAVFAKSEDGKISEKATISWMPKSEKIVIMSYRPEEGVNMDLSTTLRWARNNSATVERFGPYEIQPELYNRAKKQEQKLTSGSVMYKAVDDKTRTTGGINCIHAISDMLCNGDQFDRYLVTGTKRGQDATAVLKAYFERFIIRKLPEDYETIHEFGCQGIRRIN